MHDTPLKDKIVKALDQQAQTHRLRQAVMQGVSIRLEENRHRKLSRWSIAGLAIAAAITGIAIIPNDMLHSNPEPQHVLNSQKLTPQLADDLEMLLVLGEDAKHGS
jgi:hypothetical protein